MTPKHKQLWYAMHRQQQHTNMCKLKTLKSEGVDILLRRSVYLQACSVVVEIDGREWVNIPLFRVKPADYHINEHYYAIKNATHRALHYALYKRP